MSENVMTDRAIIDNDNLAQPKNVLQPPKNSKNNPPSTIRVAVRVRPLNEKEKYISNFDTARVVDKNLLVLLDPQYEMSPDDVTKFSFIRISISEITVIEKNNTHLNMYLMIKQSR